MSQLQETRCLTKEQIEITLSNWFKVLGVTSHEKIADGKPVFSKENEEKWNLPHITKFADNYTVYRCKAGKPPSYIPSTEHTENIIKQPETLFIITLETDKFDKLNISACIWYYHLFEKELDKNVERPQVFICPAFVITDAMTLHVPINILPCLYRFVSLCEMYPMIGSKNGLFGMSYDYKIIKCDEPCNGRKYSIIYDYDVMSKILNALPGDIIECKRILFEGTPYCEYYRREVINTATDINIIAPSGICLGKEI